MECIVLAGGMGTRLRAAVSDRPKPMADVAGKPFLQWQLDSLIDRGVDRFILATGYLSEQISSFFAAKYRGCDISYSVEDEPLGTGGAVVKAMLQARRERVLVTNGDTYCDVSLQQLAFEHAEIVMSVLQVPNVDRYGSVLLDASGQFVSRFLPKGEGGSGLINAGTYLINKDQFLKRKFSAKFSLESEYLPAICAEGGLLAVASRIPFIDIGIPEDYSRAQTYIVESAKLRGPVSF
jgi:D-glycero-alpha-D-manno-heptose 1-phosphate guanylyltransferase